MKLVMIRHGLTDALEKHLYYGAVDIPLNEKGKEELIRFRNEGVYPDFSGYDIYTSGMIRTEQTLELIMGKVDHTVEPRFREMNFGDFELKSYEDLKDRDDYQHWLTDVGSIPCPGGGEKADDFGKRVLEAANEIIAGGKDSMLVIHGGVISKIMQQYFPGIIRNYYEWTPASGKGYIITFDGPDKISWESIE